MQTGKPVAVISSTVADLPKHRWEVRDACLRQEFFPKMMEHLPASDANAITMSLALVEEAEVYVGIFAHRYGYVPEGYEVSITEMEYQHASKLHLERLIFLIGDNHAPLDGAEEQGSERALRLESLKNRLKETHVVNFFDSAEDLRGKLIHSLSRLRPREVTQVHRLSDIPMAPEPYIASPYTLLKPEGLVGRQHELEFLNNWMANTVDGLSGAAVLILSAMGGTGKSALAWTWFSDIAPDKIKPLPGKLWWSFYESDAQFENFLTRALAYASGHSEAALRQLPRPERERDLLALLNGKPFLLVLDGLERLLLAYSGRDAPFREGQLAGEEASLRACTDPRDGAFLRRLLSIRAARVLIGTRLIPAELQDETGASLPGIYVKELQGLTDNGAIELWRSLGVSGKPEKLISVFRTFGNHPLGIKVLAGEVGRYRKSPGDFERWRQDHDQVFDPFAVKGIQTMMRHTVAVALQGLGPDERQLLAMIAGFRMPASYDTLVALLVGGGRPFSRESDLDRGLAELEERGLVGWDRSANRYDLHPIIRGVAWSALDREAKVAIRDEHRAHFKSITPQIHLEKVNRVSDLTPALELFYALIDLERYDEALTVYRDRLQLPLVYRLNEGRLRVDLVDALFPTSLEAMPRLTRKADQGRAVNARAQAYSLYGRPGAAVKIIEWFVKTPSGQDTFSGHEDYENNSVRLQTLAGASLLSGGLFRSYESACCALELSRQADDSFGEATALDFLGLVLAARGELDGAGAAWRRMERIFSRIVPGHDQAEAVVNSRLAKWRRLAGDLPGATQFAARAWDAAADAHAERDAVGIARLQGDIALALGSDTGLEAAEERLHYALAHARGADLAEEELPTLASLAELRRRQHNLKGSRELLEQVWKRAEEGPYPFAQADAYNLLALIEQEAGDHQASVAAATLALRRAWCDGPPFAYASGLETARRRLSDLGAQEPGDLRPFRAATLEVLPEIEIDTAD